MLTETIFSNHNGKHMKSPRSCLDLNKAKNTGVKEIVIHCLVLCLLTISLATLLIPDFCTNSSNFGVFPFLF